jgi:single-stranded-DNA-specific exonuclease
LITEADLESVLEVDGGLLGKDMSFETAQTLEKLVWGQGFAPPLFYDAFEVVNQRVLGEKHLKLTLKLVSHADSTSTAPVIDAIYFNHSKFLDGAIQAAYQLQTNTYNGTQKVQLNIKHIAV